MRSERYEYEIGKAAEAWAARMDRLPAVLLTDAMYEAGLDAWPKPWRDAQQEVFEERLRVGEYELSYNQMCIAVYRAGSAAGKITL